MDEKADLYPGFKIRYALYIIFAVIALAVIFFLLDYAKMPTTYAVYDPSKTDYYLNNLDELKSLYNENANRIPSFARWLFGNERMNVTLVRTNGSNVALAVETRNGLINNIQKGQMKDPTMNINVKEDTLKRISESKRPVDALKKALDTGEIKYETIKAKSAVKMGVLRNVVRVMSWFG